MTAISRIALVGVLVLGAAAWGDDDEDTDTSATTEADTGSDATTGDREGEGEGAADPSLDPIVIGFINQEGATPSYPDPTVGTEATVEYINEELGGIAGHPIELRSCFVKSTEEEALSCAQEMANDDEVLFVTFGYITSSAPIYSTLADAGKYVIGGSPGTTRDTTAENAIFWDPGGSAVAAAVAKFAVDHLEPEKLGVMHLSGQLGQTSMGVVGPVLEASGVDYTTAENELDGTNSRTAATTLGEVDTVLALVTEPVCIQLAQARPSLPIADATVAASSSCLSTNVRDAVGDDLVDGWYSITLTPHPELEGDPEVDKYREVLAEYGDSDSVHALSLRKYSDMLAIRDILIPLVKSGDPLTSEAIWQAAFDFTGPLVAGSPDVACPGAAATPAVCAAQFRAAQFQDGGFTDALDGESFSLDD